MPTYLLKYLQPFVTTLHERIKDFFLWEIFIKKIEIYFVLNNTGCYALDEIPQWRSSKRGFN